MKILMPYYVDGDIDIESARVIGGVERFGQLVYENIDNVIPFYFNDKMRKARKVTDNLIRVINETKPDVMIANYDSNTITRNIQNNVNIPILWITHQCAGGISRLDQTRAMLEFTKKGGTLAMVSRFQLDGMNKLSRRVNGCDLTLDGGFINPSFAANVQPVKAEYDAVTVGRLNKQKNPFWLNKKLYGTSLNNKVITSYTDEVMKGAQLEYYEANQHWTNVLKNMSYADTMSNMSRASCYISTWPAESYGITALEALSYGLPTVLVANSTGIHASEDIADSKDDVVVVKSSIKTDELKEIVETLSKYNREDIAYRTQQKNSVDVFKNKIMSAIKRTIDKHQPAGGGLEGFM